MTALPVAFRANAGRYSFLGVTSLVNAFAEPQGNDAKGPLAALPCHGSVAFSTVTDTPNRGMFFMADLGVLVVVHENSVYTVDSNGGATARGVIPGIGNVQFARNNKATPQLVILDDVGTPWVLENNAVSVVTDPDLPLPVQSIADIGGYIVYFLEDGRFFLSSLDEAKTLAALDFATAEASPDKGVRAFRLGSEVYFFGADSCEPWRLTNAATDDIPLAPMPTVIQKGLLAVDAVAAFDNSIAFAGHDRIVYRFDGFRPVRISNNEVERAIEDDADQESITATSWTIGGHAFFNLTGSTWSYTYDAATQFWHKRESYAEPRWRHQHSVFAFGKVLIGDRNSGTLYSFDKDTYTEAGSALLWQVVSPTMHIFPNGGVVDALYLDIATGVGLATGQGSNPKLMLSKSIDGGSSFGIAREIPLGRSGNRTRVKVNRLGKFGPLGVVWKLTISDPVARALVNADARVRPLKK